MQRKKILIAVLAIALLIGAASAAVLTYYGTIRVTVDVKQSILVDDKDYTQMIEDVITEPAPGGETFCFKHWLHNYASVPARVVLETAYSPALVANEIVTTYWLPIGFKQTVTIVPPPGSIPAVITVEEVDCSIKWTIDMNETTGPFKNGHAAVGLIIGVGDKILYQVHSNDGTCAAYPWGTWLYSPYDQTGGGWFGWHTSAADWNTEVDAPLNDNLGINCTGKRDLSENPTLVYTISISKRLLSCGEFKWAMALMGDTSNTYTPSAYQWSDTGTTNFYTAVVGTQIVGSLTLLPSKKVDFIICHGFDFNIAPGTYYITTTVKPAP